MKIWTFGSSPQSASWNAWTQIKNVNGASSLSNFWNFFGGIQTISCRDWWPWTKPGYITITWRQNNNQWRGGIAAHPSPKNSDCKNPLEKFSPRFFGIKTASSLIVFQRAKLSTPSIAHLCWCNWRTFWRKNATVSSPRRSCSCTTIPRLTGQLQPRTNWHSVRCRGHCCLGDLVGRTTFWILWSGLQKLEQMAKKCIDLRGTYVQ